MALVEVDHVGFTGSRRGMTTYQLDMLGKFLERRRSLKGVGWFHHGICVGADHQAHKIAKALGYNIHGHPPVNQALVFEHDPNTDFNKYESTFSYSGRNQRIILASKIIFAAPRKDSVGTFNAIDHAAAIKRPRVIVSDLPFKHQELDLQPGDL